MCCERVSGVCRKEGKASAAAREGELGRHGWAGKGQRCSDAQLNLQHSNPAAAKGTQRARFQPFSATTLRCLLANLARILQASTS